MYIPHFLFLKGFLYTNILFKIPTCWKRISSAGYCCSSSSGKWEQRKSLYGLSEATCHGKSLCNLHCPGVWTHPNICQQSEHQDISESS